MRVLIAKLLFLRKNNNPLLFKSAVQRYDFFFNWKEIFLFFTQKALSDSP